MDVLRKGE